MKKQMDYCTCVTLQKHDFFFFFYYIVFSTSCCQKCHGYAALAVCREVSLNFCQISVHLQKSLKHFSQKGFGLVVPVYTASFYYSTILVFLVDGLFPVFICFSGALLFSTILLMKLRNLFLHIFIDSQAFERRKSLEF